jgi:TRAP-type C4-dicarboxylate transport system permease large subunit
MGEILYRTKLRRCSGPAPWLTWLPGRLMHVNVLACGISARYRDFRRQPARRSPGRAAQLLKRGYDEKTALSPCGAGTLGILLPPSIIMGRYAVASSAILKVFLAGFLPGFSSWRCSPATSSSGRC